MKVWLVMANSVANWEQPWVDSVWSTEELAEERAANFEYATVEEWQVDEIPA